LRARIKIWSRK